MGHAPSGAARGGPRPLRQTSPQRSRAGRGHRPRPRHVRLCACQPLSVLQEHFRPQHSLSRRCEPAAVELVSSHGARAVVEDAYEGVVLEREVRLPPPEVHILDRCRADGERLFSWLFHVRGEISLRAEGKRASLSLPRDGLFPLFKPAGSIQVKGRAVARWANQRRVFATLTVEASGPIEAMWGECLGNPVPDTLGTLILRTRRRRVEFRARLTIYGPPRPPIKAALSSRSRPACPT